MLKSETGNPQLPNRNLKSDFTHVVKCKLQLAFVRAASAPPAEQQSSRRPAATHQPPLEATRKGWPSGRPMPTLAPEAPAPETLSRQAICTAYSLRGQSILHVMPLLQCVNAAVHRANPPQM